ncbi:AAA family ATPase [uncultured Actinobacillus sp.]|uniref:AAA family ATPase n=1 Tax=uncultured Actinobacillus sp. TaxID=417616 RepID=UPI0025E49B3C|nr:AAA family ATPase [uncultured Actinobacillus sp.]
MYLEKFEFPSEYKEESFIDSIKRTCYTSYYPFKIFPLKHLSSLTFSPITILYGGNGSGKTTLLNIIAEKLKLNRKSSFNRTSFFDNYIDLCNYESNFIPRQSQIITSDDVFDFMLDLRAINDGIDIKRELLFEEYNKKKFDKNGNLKKIKGFSLDNFEEDSKKLKEIKSVRVSQSTYIKQRLENNIKANSNGESAFRYFIQRIEENALYLLDEPENSLSSERQLELAQYIEDSARFYHCQFIIATHSPFVLAMKHTKIYNLDTIPVKEAKSWTELNNMRAFYELFKRYSSDFEK